ncbi:MAG: pyrrolysine--tRNA(Pyl) ligase small subunit [Desulfopila sp.]
MSEGDGRGRRYYRTRIELFRLLAKMKLWPSRTGILHGIKAIEYHGNHARITTHCQKSFVINDSRNSRAARALRNKWFSRPCPLCNVPQWKLEKYSSTRFNRRYGSNLAGESGQSIGPDNR